MAEMGDNWKETTWGEVKEGDDIYWPERMLRATVLSADGTDDPNGMKFKVEAEITFRDAFNWPVEIKNCRAIEDREPTDDEIYNGFGMEGGIAYDTTGDTRDEHDPTL